MRLWSPGFNLHLPTLSPDASTDHHLFACTLATASWLPPLTHHHLFACTLATANWLPPLTHHHLFASTLATASWLPPLARALGLLAAAW